MVMCIKRVLIPSIIASVCILAFCLVLSVSAEGKNIELHKDIDIGNKKVGLEYEREIKSSDNKNLLIYTDSEKNEYVIKDDKVIGYLQNKKITKDDNKSSKKINYSTDDIKKMPLLTDLNFDEYKLGNIKYVKSYDETVYVYYKYINGIQTNDIIDVSFNSDGNISSYSAPRQGLFDNLVSDINVDKVNSYVENVMNNSYKNIKHNLETIYIDYRDGKYVVVCDVALYYNEYIDSVELLYSL